VNGDHVMKEDLEELHNGHGEETQFEEIELEDDRTEGDEQSLMRPEPDCPLKGYPVGLIASSVCLVIVIIGIEVLLG